MTANPFNQPGVFSLKLPKRFLLGAALSLFSLLLLQSQPVQASEKTVDPFTRKLKVFERAYDQVEKQYETLESFTGKHLRKKFGTFDSSVWDRWAQQWEGRSLIIKREVQDYRQTDPVVYDYFLLCLRSLNVLAYEYRKFFYWERATLENLESFRLAYREAKEALAGELQYLRQKRQALQPASDP